MTEITRYFDLLPDSSLKRDYQKMLDTGDPVEKTRLQKDACDYQCKRSLGNHGASPDQVQQVADGGRRVD